MSRVEDLLKIKYGDWWENKELADAASKAHDRNLAACRRAIDYHHSKDRPLEVLVVHGSPRSNFQKSAAQEPSNSQSLLELGLAQAKLDHVAITRVNLRDYEIEPCEGCVSTASALCGFPCTCFPFDPMQKLYTLCLRADVMLMSTGVNQSAMSTRLKAFCDRLISLDGGFLVDKGQYHPKDTEFRETAIAMSKDGNFEYMERLFGRVAAYFIASKDEANPHDKDYNYVKQVAGSLRKGFEDYGMFHAEDWCASVVANPDVDYCHDKSALVRDKQTQMKAAHVVESAVTLARQYRENPPEAESSRRNRT